MLDGRRQILTAAYRRAPSTAARGGVRAPGSGRPARALEGVEVVAVDGLDPERLADVDRPDDLHRYAQPHTSRRPAARRTQADRPAERGSL